MIQVIPFAADWEPYYLPLLARGLSDLSVLRFNAVDIEAQVNVNLKMEQWEQDPQMEPIGLGTRDIWFTGKLSGNGTIAMVLT